MPFFRTHCFLLWPNRLRAADTTFFAYLSVGEFEGKVLPDDLGDVTLGMNLIWQSQVMDLSSVKWQQFLLEQATEYRKLGYDGIFLDTLDSYTLFTDKNGNQKQ